MKNITGFKTHRHRDNRLEQRIHDDFKKEFLKDLKDIVYVGVRDHQISTTEVSDHQKRLILTVVQWFGSPVGQHFYNQTKAAHDKAVEKSKKQKNDA